MSKKHQQFILAAHKAFFDGNGFYVDPIKALDMQQFLQDVQPYLTVRQRAWLEQDTTYRQLIPYAVLSYRDDQGIERFVGYQRLEGGGEQRLHGKVSVGFGGHVDLRDVSCDANSVLDLKDTLARAVEREVTKEELQQYVPEFAGAPSALHDFQLEWPGLFIAVDTTPVDQVHAAMIVQAVIPQGVALLSGEDANLKLLPEALTAQEWLASGHDFETWTRVYLEYRLQHG